VTTTDFAPVQLGVVSAWQALALVGDIGDAATTVSASGVQLLMLIDEQEELNGLALSNPAASSSGSAIDFTVASTAEALIYQTPGILTTNPAEYPERSEQIRNLASFPAFTSFLSAQLPLQTIEQLAALSEYQQLLHNCVQEWFNEFGLPMQRSSNWLLMSDAASQVYPTLFENPSDPSRTRVKFENWGWRYVEIVRREMIGDAENSVSVVSDGSLEVFGGAIPISWGNLWKIDFTQWPPTNYEVGNPHTRYDTVNLSASSPITTYEYWVRGPGFAEATDVPPASVVGGMLDTYGTTTLCYVVVPTLDLFLGFFGDVSRRMETFAAIYDTYKLVMDGGKVTTLTAHDPGSQAFTTALGDLAIHLLTLTVNSESIRSALIQKGALSAKSIAFIQVALKFGAIGISAADLYMVGETLKQAPRYSKARLFNRYGDIDIIIE